MPKTLVTHSETHEVRVDLVREALPGHEVEAFEVPPGSLEVPVTDAFLDALAGADAVLLRPGRITADVLDAAPDLRVVACHSSGFEHVDLDAATERGVVVTHNPEGPGPCVAEHALALAFSLLRDLPETFERTAAGEWTAARAPVTELSEVAVGVLGLGTIGFDVARHAVALGADVLGHDPYVSGEATSPIWPRYDRGIIEDAGVELLGKDALFERADLVTIHTPLTEETREMVGGAELDRLAGGYLVNTARGGVVDEDALVRAVEAGDLAGVALDVLAEEPPEESPLMGAPGVYITPHVGGVSDAYLVRAAEAGARKIRAALAGDRPETVVNPEVFADA